MAVPGELSTERQPPLAIPLSHFVVGLGFLLAGGVVGLADATGLLGGRAGLAHVHLLLAGWVCLTIMGAMTQFVPVWSGVELYSRRLASLQLWLVVAGLVGFVAGLLSGRVGLLPVFGLVLAAGFWAFVYNLGRTLRRVESYDVTERHFGVALAFFLVVTALGVALAVDLAVPLFGALPVGRSGVVGAHATVAVFGAVLTTVLGALYQLSTMFTRTELHGVDVALQRFETVCYPLGVVVLAAGRLAGFRPAGVAGGLLVVGGLASASVVLARRLVEANVEWTPLLSRYAVLAGSLAVWALLALPAWLGDPIAPEARFGPPGGAHLLAVGVVGFVVLGTLYHVVPFIVWVHRYSDRLGYEAVPMVEDLYSDRIAAADFWLLLLGGGALVAADAGLTDSAALGGVSLLAGSLLVCWNMVGVIREHSPRSLRGVLTRSPEETD